MRKNIPFAKLRNLPAFASIISIFAFLILACGGSSPLTQKTPEAPKTPEAVKSEPAKAAAPPASEIAGDYKVNGSNQGGGGKYQGDLIITERGDVYQFSWSVGSQQYEGVGIQSENTVAVAFTQGGNGKGCRVVHYKIGADGALDGRWGEWGVNDDGTEKAVKSGGSGIEGDYETSGTNLSGEPYKGKLKVSAKGAGYDFSWDTNDKGFGIKSGDFISVGIGGANCGFVAYEIKGDGSMAGKWGLSGTTDIGTEAATRK